MIRRRITYDKIRRGHQPLKAKLMEGRSVSRAIHMDRYVPPRGDTLLHCHVCLNVYVHINCNACMYIRMCIRT